MKIIHLNVESFKYFDALVDFLETEKPDILSLVEATDGSFFGPEGGAQRDYLGELCQRFSWNQVFHPTIFRDMGECRISLGAAVLSRFSLSVESQQYFGEQKPTIVPNNSISFSDKPKYERYPHAWKWSLPFLVTKIQTEQGVMRLLTSHFHVSYECLETLQIWQDAERIAEYLETTDNTPLVLTGDFNIRNESMAIKTLSEKLTQQSGHFSNTLTRSIHPCFEIDKNRIGLGIDHIFTRDVFVNSCEIREVEVSDHLPLVLDFSL
ncbi:endonuclease/exonuclease/phosphatase family protein [Candidatus Gracilibacteria bacterium]|nr:endonuclease/exonuclease/phosphatase family protein [Candidatus Gracilibacteria bacterium]